MQYRVTSARERGYLVSVEGKRGRAARYRAGNPLPEDVIILPERIEGVNSHPNPLHTPSPMLCRRQRGCEGVNQPEEGQAGSDSATCTECGESLDPALVQAGFTTHGEEANRT